MFSLLSLPSHILKLSQSLRGHPLAWVNNQFRQYTFDVSNLINSPTTTKDNNLTVAFESAWHYGLNVTARPDAEFFPGGAGVRTSDNVSNPSWFIPRCT